MEDIPTGRECYGLTEQLGEKINYFYGKLDAFRQHIVNKNDKLQIVQTFCQFAVIFFEFGAILNS